MHPSVQQRSPVRSISLAVIGPGDRPSQQVTILDFDQAEEQLAAWGAPARGSQAVPVQVTILFENGLMYLGRYYLEPGGLDTYDQLLRECVLHSLRFRAGVAQPRGISQVAYLGILESHNPEMLQLAAQMLATCQIAPVWG